MILITYQKMFSFTHNDLHTNNIMYIETEKRFLYYKINHRHYKIPTYGKIFKIIDYGRAIYNLKIIHLKLVIVIINEGNLSCRNN